ncbi:MAG: hypothetical protein ACLTLI_07185 [Clostridia bacterium]
MVNPDNAELYEVTSLSVNIEDDEPKEKSVVSFSRNSYTSKDGNVTVTIKRKMQNILFAISLCCHRALPQ